MKRARVIFFLCLVAAALLGIGLGWWLRDASDEDSVEHRAHQAAEHMREAVRSLTR
jgi:hypothetical protein